MVLEKIQGHHPAIHLVVLLRGHGAAVHGQGVAFPDALQIGEVDDDCGLLAAEGEVDEVLDVGQAKLDGHGLEFFDFTLAEAVQPFGQVVQLVNRQMKFSQGRDFSSEESRPFYFL